MEKTTRILRLFEMLMTYQEFTLAEGAETFGVSRKTVCRDLRLLSQAGVVRCRWSKRLGASFPGMPGWFPRWRTKRK